MFPIRAAPHPVRTSLNLIDRPTIMIVTQCLTPSHRPIAADGGCNSTKVMKKSDTARLRSSGVVPISVLKPERCQAVSVCPGRKSSSPWVSAFPTLERSNPLNIYRVDKKGSKAMSIFLFTRRDLTPHSKLSAVIDLAHSSSSTRICSDPSLVLSKGLMGCRRILSILEVCLAI